jgi:hypothetical protein
MGKRTFGLVHVVNVVRMMHMVHMMHALHMCNSAHIVLILHTRTNCAHALASIVPTSIMVCVGHDGTGDTMAGRTTGSVSRTDARLPSQRATLGMRGVLGTGRNAVAYAYRSHGDGVNICPARAYTREPMAGRRERALVRFTVRTSVGTGTARTSHYDPWDGTRRILPNAPYVGGEAWRREQRERVRNAPQGTAHTCPSERRDVTRKCTCAAFGGVPHQHRTDDGIAYAQAPRMTYAQVLANIDARERAA